MDLYTTILQKGGTLLQDGSAWRDLVSKDGQKLIRQFAKQNGEVAVDVFERNSGNLVSCVRRTVKPDNSFISKVYDASGLKQLFALQKLGEKDNGTFMSALFKRGASIKNGEFIHAVNKKVEARGGVTHMPFNNSLMPKNNSLAMRTNIFNQKFGKIDLK